MTRDGARPRMSDELRSARGRLGAAVRHVSRHPLDLLAHRTYSDAVRDFHALSLEDHVRYVRDLAPPLTDEQRRILVDLLENPRLRPGPGA